MPALLPPGHYSFECEAFSGNTLLSDSQQVTGPAVHDAHPFVPPEIDVVQSATIAYQNSLLPYLKRLEVDTDAVDARGGLRRPVGGTLALASRPTSTTASGAAYDTFGNFNEEINGRPFGLQGGVDSPHFMGFLRLEYGLWHQQPSQSSFRWRRRSTELSTVSSGASRRCSCR